MTCAYDDVTCAYDDVTCAYDDSHELVVVISHICVLYYRLLITIVMS